MYYERDLIAVMRENVVARILIEFSPLPKNTMKLPLEPTTKFSSFWLKDMPQNLVKIFYLVVNETAEKRINISFKRYCVQCYCKEETDTTKYSHSQKIN